MVDTATEHHNTIASVARREIQSGQLNRRHEGICHRREVVVRLEGDCLVRCHSRPIRVEFEGDDTGSIGNRECLAVDQAERETSLRWNPDAEFGSHARCTGLGQSREGCIELV